MPDWQITQRTDETEREQFRGNNYVVGWNLEILSEAYLHALPHWLSGEIK